MRLGLPALGRDVRERTSATQTRWRSLDGRPQEPVGPLAQVVAALKKWLAVNLVDV
jgi:hypothetical protein